MSTISILGAGTWGIALARMLSQIGHEVLVWSAIESEIENLEKTRQHPNLKKMSIPSTVKFTKSIQSACENKDIILFAVPSIYVRETAKKAKAFIKDNQIIVDVAKGIEESTLFTMTEVIKDELKKNVILVALSGPTHAEEVALDLPTTIVSACEDLESAEKVQEIFMNSCMRVYTNPDVKGVQLCGAMKNIIALACGISTGLGYGDNAKAALITRGMREVSRLGLAMGCKSQTFSGLAGIGDLIVTATSIHSRNNKCGLLIGQGKKVEEAIKEVGMVVEGINAIPAAIKLSKLYNIELPIINAVNDVINNNKVAKEVVYQLMTRDKKTELM